MTLPEWDGRAQRWRSEIERRIDAEFCSQHDTMLTDPTHFTGIPVRYERRTLVGRVVRWAKCYGAMPRTTTLMTVVYENHPLPGGWQGWLDRDSFTPRESEHRALAQPTAAERAALATA